MYKYLYSSVVMAKHSHVNPLLFFKKNCFEMGKMNLNRIVSLILIQNESPKKLELIYYEALS